MLSKKNHFSYCNCLSPNYLVLLQYFPMRHQGLLQLILNVGEKNKKTWESIEFCVGVFNNPQTSRSTIYLGYPDFCLFPICEKQTSRTWSDDIQCWGLPMGCLSHTENSEHPRGEKGKTGMWSLTVSGKGILWFCSPGFSPNSSRSTGANHCLPLRQLLGADKKAGDQKTPSSHLWIHKDHFVFMTSTNHVIIRF